jgi:hypothetical protein
MTLEEQIAAKQQALRRCTDAVLASALRADLRSLQDQLPDPPTLPRRTAADQPPTPPGPAGDIPSYNDGHPS